jgi:hypothetical protein
MKAPLAFAKASLALPYKATASGAFILIVLH